MRLPLPTNLSVRDAGVDKDAYLKNSFNGSEEDVVKRAGSVDLGLIAAGTGQMLACWESSQWVIANDTFNKVSISGQSATVVSTTAISPATADLSMTNSQTGGAQTNQQLFFKSAEQGWIYTE